jgi:hypothetical protein
MNWIIPKDLWKDEEVWIIGGGPSVSRQFQIPEELIQKVEKGLLPVSVFSPYMSDLYDKPVIGVNMAYQLGPWLDMVFWGDPSFYRKPGVKEDLRAFPNLKIGVHQWFNDKKMEGEGIKAIAREKQREGLSDVQDKIRWNFNSGASAINIAANAGAKRIILVGFDMHVSPSHSHWHNLYGKPKTPPFKTHLKGFKQISIDAKRRGIEIINACPDSAIPYFPKANVKDLITLKSNATIVVDTDFEKSQGSLAKYQTISQIQKNIQPDLYLEIGVGRGNSLRRSCAKNSIGIDPRPRIHEKLPKNVVVHKEESKLFFKKNNVPGKIDFAFIDGKHLIENVLEDFIAVEKHSKSTSYILLDDVAPAHPIQANRLKQSSKWAGDCWKIVPILKKYRPDLDIKLLDVAPTGMLLVSNLDPSNTVLEKNYEEIINQWQNEIMPLSVLKRKGAKKDLSFFKKTSKKNIKVGLVTPTCSPERKPFLDFLDTQIAKQTRQPDEWIMVDYPNDSGKPDLTKRYKEGIQQAFDKGCDFVLFIEDDDYYPPTYIEDMVEGWQQAGFPSVFGVDESIYYHIGSKKFHFFKEKAHCSAFCTGVARDVVTNVCQDTVIFFDMRLWKHNESSAKIKLPIGRKPIGIKHGLGASGGSFHSVHRFRQSNDDTVTIKDYVDADALDFYENIKL